MINTWEKPKIYKVKSIPAAINIEYGWAQEDEENSLSTQKYKNTKDLGKKTTTKFLLNEMLKCCFCCSFSEPSSFIITIYSAFFLYCTTLLFLKCIIFSCQHILKTKKLCWFNFYFQHSFYGNTKIVYENYVSQAHAAA